MLRKYLLSSKKTDSFMHLILDLESKRKTINQNWITGAPGEILVSSKPVMDANADLESPRNNAGGDIHTWFCTRAAQNMPKPSIIETKEDGFRSIQTLLIRPYVNLAAVSLGKA